MTLGVLSSPMIDEEIEHEIVTISVDTTESLGFLPIVYQITPSFLLLVIIWTFFEFF